MEIGTYKVIKTPKTKRRDVVIATLITCAALALFAFHSRIMAALDNEMHATNAPVILAPFAPQKAEAAETTEARIEAKKWEIVDALATSCESKTAAEPDALLIFDSNNVASIGAWQFQVLTVQGYVQQFEHREISRHEATLLALDHAKARDLAYKIIWTDSGKGIDNWYNCAHVKSDFAARVAYIKQVEKDFIK